MKRIIDKNGRLFGLISIIDVLVILVVAVLVLALWVKDRNPQTGTTVSIVPITMVLEVEAVPTYVASAIRVGDTVYDKDQATGGAIGKITEVELLPSAYKTQLTDGTYREIPVEDCNNVRIKVEGSGLVTDKGYFAINRIYYVGKNASRNLYTKYAAFQASFAQVERG